MTGVFQNVNFAERVVDGEQICHGLLFMTIERYQRIVLP